MISASKAPKDDDENQNVGISVAIYDNMAIVGSWRDAGSGSAYAYTPDNDKVHSHFGHNVALDSNNVIVGASNDYNEDINGGSTYLHTFASILKPSY